MLGRFRKTHDWGYRGQGAGGQQLAFERARVIGGCSAQNGCALFAGWRGDCDAWASGCPGWSGEELRPRFARSAVWGVKSPASGCDLRILERSGSRA